MTRILLAFMIVAMVGCSANESFNMKRCSPTVCKLNKDGDPICYVMCPDGYAYVWFPQERIRFK